MPTTLTLPKLSPTMEEGTIVAWHKNEGDFVEAGDVLLEIATDKATVEYNALDSGYLRKIIISKSGSAIVNQPIAIFTEKATDSIEGYVPVGAAIPEKKVEVENAKLETGEAVASTSAVASLQKVTYSKASFLPEPPLENYTFNLGSEANHKRTKASPLAKKIAEEKNLDIHSVKGTGPGGRVVATDLSKAQPSGDFSFGKDRMPTEIPGSYIEEALTPLRKVIAERLQDSKSFIPHFYVQQTINTQPLIDLREQLRELNVKVTFNDFIIRASSLALRKHPVVNSGFNSANNTIIRFKTIDISVAVTIPEGLITPIIRHADFKNLGEISTEMRSLAYLAKAGKLKPEEYKGGSFTISNMGMYGVSGFQAIINPPQAAILAISGMQEVPVIKKGNVVPGKIMNICLSADHRVIDGVAAAEFLSTLRLYLENPASLII